MRIALLAAITVGLTATSASAQGVPDRSQAARVDMGYRRFSSFRVDPFRHVMIPHWGLVVSAGASGENTVLNFSDIGALLFLDDSTNGSEIQPGDIIDVLGLIPAGKGVRAVVQAEGGAYLGGPFGRHFSLGFSVQGRGYGSAKIADSAIAILRDGNLNQQDFNLGNSGVSALATVDIGVHTVLRFGPFGGDDGMNLALGIGGRLVRPGAYVRARSEVGSPRTIRVTADSIVLDLAFETLVTPENSIDERFTGGFGSGVVGDFLMRLEWPTQGFAFEAMVANIGTMTIKQLQRDSASLFLATADPLNDLVDALDALSFETRDTVDVDVRLPRIVRFSASAWANRILQLDLSTTMPVGGEFETPLIMDVGTTWRFLKNLPLRAGLIIGGHQGLGYSGGFAFEGRNMLFQVAGQSLGGFLTQAKGAGARFDFGFFF